MRFKRVYIEITNICNLKCSFCSKSSRAPREMTSGEFLLAASQIRAVTDYIYLHVKGEPLAHSEIDKILTICDELKFKVNITTNGTLLEKNKNILISHSSIRQINISLHSSENEAYTQGYINEVISVAQFLSKYFMISMRIWTYDKENPAQKIIFKALSERFKNKTCQSVPRCTLSDNIFFSLGEVFDWPSPLLPDFGENGFCLGTRSQIAILSNGDVVPCCLDSDAHILLGNIFNEPLEKILVSDRFLKMYNGLSKRILTENLCRHCSYRLRFNK